MAQLWDLFEEQRPALDAIALDTLLQVPVLADVVRMMDPAVLQAQRDASHRLQRAAMVEGEWLPYLRDLHRQGEVYAAMGMRFSDWYRLVAPARAVLMPHALARPHGQELLEALSRLVDATMAELGDAYVLAKQGLVTRTEQERDAYIENLERSNQELDSFAYVASHDLKAPLRDIDNLSGWILEDAAPVLPPESRRHLDRLRDRVARMEGLLDDLLAYSRAGRRVDASESFAVGDAVASALALVGPRGSIRVEVKGVWPTVETPRAPLELVLRNLVGNAIKHHDRDDGIVVVGGGARGDHVELWVDDDGPGIPAAFHERVFQMFQTLRPRDQVEGSGMGLAIVKKVVASMGGQVVLVSSGRGSRFTFTWPLRWPLERR